MYSIPLTLANSRSCIISWSRLAKAMSSEGVDVPEVEFELIDPSSASREYVKPFTCSTRSPSTVPKCSTLPSAGDTYKEPFKCTYQYIHVYILTSTAFGSIGRTPSFSRL